MTELREIQQEEIKMLKIMNEIVEQNNLHYILAWGSALGAVREKGFIPWDDDVDIFVSIDEYKNFINTMKRELPKEYKIYSVETEPNYEVTFARIGLKDKGHLKIHIDVFPLAGAPKLPVMRKIFSRLSLWTLRLFKIKKVRINVNYAGNTKRKIIAFIGKTILFFIPSKVFLKMHNWLLHLYPIQDADVLFYCLAILKKDWYFKIVKMDFEGLKLNVPSDWHNYLVGAYGEDYMKPKKDNYENNNINYNM